MKIIYSILLSIILYFLVVLDRLLLIPFANIIPADVDSVIHNERARRKFMERMLIYLFVVFVAGIYYLVYWATKIDLLTFKTIAELIW